MPLPTKPDFLPRWASVLINNGPNGGANRQEPPDSSKDDGFDYLEKPPREWVNWVLYYNYLWAQYTSDAVDFIVNDGLLPAGTILDFGGSSAPAGFLLCDASAVSRTTYAALFTAIGTNFGAGNGTTTFNVPDFRGRTSIGAGQGLFSYVFTANATTDILTIPSNRSIYSGTPVQVSSTGTLPSPLLAATTYYAIRISDTEIELSTTQTNAVVTDSIPIDITTAGTGTLTITGIDFTNFSVGNNGGEENHSIISAELTSDVLVNLTSGHGATSGGGFNINQNSPAGSPGNNMQPYLAVTKIIKT